MSRQNQFSPQFLNQKMKELDKIEAQRLMVINEIAIYGYETMNFPLAEKYANLAYDAAKGHIDVLLNKAKIDVIVNPERTKRNIEEIETAIKSLPDKERQKVEKHLNYIKAKHYLYSKQYEKLREIHPSSIEVLALQEIGNSILEERPVSLRKLSDIGIQPTNKQFLQTLFNYMLETGEVERMYELALELEKVFPVYDPFRITLKLLKLQALKLYGMHERGYKAVKMIYETTRDPMSLQELEYFAQATKRFDEYRKIKKEKHIVNIASAMGIPKFTGNENVSGKTMLIVTDQGFGDNIQNARYLESFFKKYPDTKIYVALYPQLKDLFMENIKEINEENAILYEVKEIAEKRPDYHLFLSEVPDVMNVGAQEMETLGNRILFKAEDPFEYDRPTIGIFWKTSVRDNITRIKNFSLEEFLKTSEIDTEKYNVISLVKEGITEGERELMNRLGIKDSSKDLKSFKDTARYIQNMEEIHSIDTAVAHLAGAMGKKTYCYIGRYRDHRWGEHIEQPTKSYLYRDLWVVGAQKPKWWSQKQKGARK